MPLLLGLDIGTSAAKAVIIDESGRVIAAGSAEYPLYQDAPLHSEQEPEDWWTGAAGAIRAALRGSPGAEIGAVGLSGQMHGLVMLGKEARESGGRAEPLARAILWNDQRTGAECRDIERIAGGRRRLVEWVGNAALPGFTLPKMMWMRGHEAGVWNRARVLMQPKDFVRLRLTGEIATDVGDASGTLLFSPDSRAWSERALAAFQISPALLPRPLESARVAGRITAWAAEQTGLAEGTPVAAGSGDNQCGAVGAGVVSPGMVCATLGTSGVIYAHSASPKKDIAEDGACGRLHTMCAATGPEGWCITGCMLSAGLSLRWARDTIAPGIAYGDLMREAAAAPAGCEGLAFLPYLTGERCPHADPHARGGWIGLTSRHTRGHLIRAVVEGVTFGLGEILDLARSIGVPVECARLTGGGNRSAFWRQMQADVFRCPVETTNSDEGGAALGAALLGGVGAGVWPGVAEACAATITVRERLEPGADVYGAARGAYAKLYGSLRERFAELGSAAG